MDMVEELLESAIAELEEYGHPELVAELRGVLAKVEALEGPAEAIEEEADEIPADEE